jgi:hypothetical protein
MDQELKILGEIKDEGGCIFPLIDPRTGKRSRLCGEATPILDSKGNKQAFCAEHYRLLRNHVPKEMAKFKRKKKKPKPKPLMRSSIIVPQ